MLESFSVTLNGKKKVDLGRKQVLRIGKDGKVDSRDVNRTREPEVSPGMAPKR